MNDAEVRETIKREMDWLRVIMTANDSSDNRKWARERIESFHDLLLTKTLSPKGPTHEESHESRKT